MNDVIYLQPPPPLQCPDQCHSIYDAATISQWCSYSFASALVGCLNIAVKMLWCLRKPTTLMIVHINKTIYLFNCLLQRNSLIMPEFSKSLSSKLGGLVSLSRSGVICCLDCFDGGLGCPAKPRTGSHIGAELSCQGSNLHQALATYQPSSFTFTYSWYSYVSLTKSSSSPINLSVSFSIRPPALSCPGFQGPQRQVCSSPNTLPWGFLETEPFGTLYWQRSTKWHHCTHSY